MDIEFENYQTDNGPDELTIDGCRAVRICIACPEVWDVFFDGKMIGYLRLRRGRFTATYPDVGGKLVYHVSLDDGSGIFSTDERREHLPKAVEALLAEHNKPA